MGSMRITIHLKPRATENKIEKDQSNEWRVWVTEPPLENRANFALIALLSKDLGLPQSAFRIVGGVRSKIKVIEVKMV